MRISGRLHYSLGVYDPHLQLLETLVPMIDDIISTVSSIVISEAAAEVNSFAKTFVEFIA